MEVTCNKGRATYTTQYKSCKFFCLLCKISCFQDFGVEIVADHVDHRLQDQDQDQIEEGAIIHEEILDGEIIGEAVLAEGDIIEEVGLFFYA